MSRTWHTRKGFQDESRKRKDRDPRPRYRRKGRADRTDDFAPKAGRVLAVEALKPQGL